MARELSKNNKGSENLERSQQGSRADIWPATYSPFGMMRQFADMDRWFDRFSPWGRGWGVEHQFSPELEILERDGKLIVRADLPGINKDDVHFHVSDNSLTMEGERMCEHEKT